MTSVRNCCYKWSLYLKENLISQSILGQCVKGGGGMSENVDTKQAKTSEELRPPSLLYPPDDTSLCLWLKNYESTGQHEECSLIWAAFGRHFQAVPTLHSCFCSNSAQWANVLWIRAARTRAYTSTEGFNFIQSTLRVKTQLNNPGRPYYWRSSCVCAARRL